MALDWDNIIIETDEYSYSLDAEQRMILFAGNKGDKGDKGDAATIHIGTVTTLPAGSPATVQNAGTQNDAIFNFGIPQGQQGDPGSDVWGAITGTLSDQTDLQDALNGIKTYADNKILYYYQQSVSVATNAQIMRIPSSGTDSKITTDTIVLECTFASPSSITSNVSWTSYAGYIAFTGTCTAATTANVTLGTKGN